MSGEALILRLEAPLMSFGIEAVDELRKTGEVPARSMLTGLVANALGWLHGDAEALTRLQERLVFAVRRDRRGEVLEDFHTVDLGQDFMRQGWTTRGRPEGRGGGSKTATHIRRRFFLAGAAYTVALTLEPAGESPTLGEVEEALRRPARPLFLGRKCCLPSRPLLEKDARVEAPDVLVALLAAEPTRSARDGDSPAVWWPADLAVPAGLVADRELQVTEDRDWRNQVHHGWRRWMAGRQVGVEAGGLSDG